MQVNVTSLKARSNIKDVTTKVTITVISLTCHPRSWDEEKEYLKLAPCVFPIPPLGSLALRRPWHNAESAEFHSGRCRASICSLTICAQRCINLATRDLSSALPSKSCIISVQLGTGQGMVTEIGITSYSTCSS